MGLRPFFTYFGGKWRIAPRYPAPEGEIIEPFVNAKATHGSGRTGVGREVIWTKAA